LDVFFFALSLSLWQLGLCWNGITTVCQQGMDRGLQHPRALDHRLQAPQMTAMDRCTCYIASVPL
jgi:hypothetical protein